MMTSTKEMIAKTLSKFVEDQHISITLGGCGELIKVVESLVAEARRDVVEKVQEYLFSRKSIGRIVKLPKYIEALDDVSEYLDTLTPKSTHPLTPEAEREVEEEEIRRDERRRVVEKVREWYLKNIKMLQYKDRMTLSDYLDTLEPEKKPGEQKVVCGQCGLEIKASDIPDHQQDCPATRPDPDPMPKDGERDRIAKEICGGVNECGRSELSQWQGCLKCVRYTQYLSQADYVIKELLEPLRKDRDWLKEELVKQSDAKTRALVRWRKLREWTKGCKENSFPDYYAILDKMDELEEKTAGDSLNRRAPDGEVYRCNSGRQPINIPKPHSVSEIEAGNQLCPENKATLDSRDRAESQADVQVKLAKRFYGMKGYEDYLHQADYVIQELLEPLREEISIARKSSSYWQTRCQMFCDRWQKLREWVGSLRGDYEEVNYRDLISEKMDELEGKESITILDENIVAPKYDVIGEGADIKPGVRYPEKPDLPEELGPIRFIGKRPAGFKIMQKIIKTVNQLIRYLRAKEGR